MSLRSARTTSSLALASAPDGPLRGSPPASEIGRAPAGGVARAHSVENVSLAVVAVDILALHLLALVVAQNEEALQCFKMAASR